MKSTKAILLVCAALILCLLNAALADGETITGRSAETVEFYVYASGNTTLTFSQTKGTLATTTGLKQSAYGGFDITWYPSYQPSAAQTVPLTGKTAAVKLSRGVYYTVRVAPQSMAALTARDAYLGLPGSYARWQTPASWTVGGVSGVRMSRTPLAGMATATPQPTAVPAAKVTVYNRLSSGSLISSRTETLAPGTHVLSGGLSSAYFTPVGNTYQTVTVYSNGTPSRSSVTFYYQLRSAATATPKPTAAPTATPATATVYVYYRLTNGSLITYSTEQLTPGTHVITGKLNGAYFTPVGNTYETVTVYNNGQASRTSVTFYYQYGSALATATPKPTAAPTPVPTAVPTPVTATITVYYRLTDGSLITYNTETLTPGTHVISSKLNAGYFTPVGNSYQSVVVYSNGAVSQSSVTFYYTYKTVTAAPTAIPTPIPTPIPTAVPAPAMASLLVQYKQSDGTLLYQETRLLGEGVHMIAYDNRFDNAYWLRFAGPTSYNVTVSNGVASVSSIVFYFAPADEEPFGDPDFYHPPFETPAPQSTPVPTIAPVPTLIPIDNEALTDQLATIGTDKIYPRPEPGRGKNTFNYEAIGQIVTVHSKALSLQNDGSWWVCISANLRCWGQDYVIDHQWIKVTYLNQRSFDLDAVPLNPNY